MYASGSNIFGDNASDLHTFIGDILATGSVRISGSLFVNGTISGSISASNAISSSYSISSSFSATSSYALNIPVVTMDMDTIWSYTGI
jgi:hypothetical protein